MQLSHRIEKQMVLLQMEGNLALDGVSDVKNYVKPFIEDSEIKAVILNFSKVNFIDSSGIGLIVSLFKYLQQHHGRLLLCELSAKNSEVFSMTRLDRVLDFYKTEAEALESHPSSPAA